MKKETITFDRFVRILGGCLLAAIILYLLNYLSGVLLPFFIAWFFAYLLYPMVKFVQYRLHVPGRVLSILVTLFVMIAVISGIIYLIIPPMIEQFDKLSALVTAYIRKSAHITNIPEAIQNWVGANQKEIEAFFTSSSFIDSMKETMPQVFNVLGQTASILISIIGSLIALMYLFFILLDYEYLTSNWIRIFPKRSRPFWRELMDDVKTNLNAYVRGQGLIALIVGVLFAIGFTIIDFPMAIGLGILIGLLNIVPYLQTLGFIPTILLAALKSADTGQNFWIILLSAFAVFAVVQVLQDMVLTPKIMGKAMGLNPAILLLSLSIWGALLGFIGLIIALPATTLLIAYYKRYVTKEGEKEVPEEKCDE